MAANTGKLAGKVVFITGASRGIGAAIALKVARDGATVVIAAKTAEAHPKLAGTIYTVAEEVKQAGGQAFPCVVDIRSEEQVVAAVNETVAKFGGIDILVNNASAISLTGTLSTPMKKFDLMNSINARGTYLCSQACLPHLVKAKNPHILNISPPLNMSQKWFSGHVAYTMAKYGMSMCVLGMSKEFQRQGVAVNALWPRTAIWTAAMEMIGGGEAVRQRCRKVDIMRDAAYVILSGNSREVTGNFFIDDDVLRSVGVKDFDQYSCVPGGKLLPDFFLETGPDELKNQIESAGGKPAFQKTSASAAAGDVGKTFTNIQSILSADLVKDIGASFQFDLKGPEEGRWYLDLSKGSGLAGQGSMDGPDCTFNLDSQLFLEMFSGKANAMAAYLAGKLVINGDMKAAMKLEKLLKKFHSKY